MERSIKRKNSNQEGTGIGLVIVKFIVEQFGGEISFASKWKKGTTFLFTFESKKFNKDDYALSQIMKFQAQ